LRESAWEALFTGDLGEREDPSYYGHARAEQVLREGLEKLHKAGVDIPNGPITS
jgi:hypothetical protein